MKIALSVAEKEKAKGADSPYFKALVAAGASSEELEPVSPPDSRHLRLDDFDGVLISADGSVGTQSKEHGAEEIVGLDVKLLVHRER